MGDHVLGDGRVGPQELAGLAVEDVDDPGLAGDAGDHPPRRARLRAKADPGDGVGVGGDRGVDEQALEGMVEVPVVVQVLVVSSRSRRCRRRGPGSSCGIGACSRCAPQQLRGRRGRTCRRRRVQVEADAWGRPRPHVSAVLVGHVAPGLVAGLAGGTRAAATAPSLPSRSRRRGPR